MFTNSQKAIVSSEYTVREPLLTWMMGGSINIFSVALSSGAADNFAFLLYCRFGSTQPTSWVGGASASGWIAGLAIPEERRERPVRFFKTVAATTFLATDPLAF